MALHGRERVKRPKSSLFYCRTTVQGRDPGNGRTMVVVCVVWAPGCPLLAIGRQVGLETLTSEGTGVRLTEGFDWPSGDERRSVMR